MNILLSGVQIVESPYMMVSREKQVRRTWRERLFTVPWRPLRTHNTVMEHVPNPDLVKVGHIFYGHPETVRKLRDRIGG